VGARAPWLSSVVSFKVLGATGCVPPLPATRLPSWHCPASRSFRVVSLAAFWFAAPSPPFLRPRGLRCTTPSGTAVPAAPSGLGVPPGYDLAARADAALKPRGDLPGVPFPYSGRDLPESVLPGGSNLRHDPPSAFHTPSTVCSSSRLPALFRPVPLMGFSLQSLAPLREAARLSAPLPSCRYEQPQSSTLRFSGRSWFSAATGSCSSRRVRTPRGCRPTARPLLSWDWASSGLSPECHGQRFRRPSRPHFDFAASREGRGVVCASGLLCTIRSGDPSLDPRPS